MKKNVVATEDDLVKALTELENLAKSDSESSEEDSAEETKTDEATDSAEESSDEAEETSKEEGSEDAEETSEEEEALEESDEEETVEKAVHKKAMHKGKKKAMHKADEDEDDDEEDEEEDEEEEEKEKSLADKNETIRKAVEVSDFLSELVGETSKALNGFEKSLEDVGGFQESAFSVLAKSVKQMISKQDEILERIEALENQPAGMRKSKATAGVKALEKGGGKVADEEKNPAELQKSVLSGLEILAQKGEIPAAEVIKFEATGECRPDLKKKALALVS